VKHHEALVAHGFTHEDICRMSSRYQSLKVVADRYDSLVEAMPGLTRAKSCKLHGGVRAQGQLLRRGDAHPVGAELAMPPLKFTSAQLTAIAASGERPALQTCHR
jgi:hypothetical protein